MKTVGRMKYCVVKSCKYFKGTNAPVKMFRCPKVIDVAKVWLSAIGVDDNNSIKWVICGAHFKDNDFERKDKSRLRAGAVPSLNLNAPNIPTGTSTDVTDSGIHVNDEIGENIENIENNNDLVPGTFASYCQNCASNSNTNCHKESEKGIPIAPDYFCEECLLKDSLILKYEKRITELERLLKKYRNKSHYLENTKTKLATNLLSAKKQQMIYAEQNQLFEVYINHKMLFIFYVVAVVEISLNS